MSGETNLSNGSEWELSKENVQPLKRGRKVAYLSAALGPSSGDYQSKIHREKQTFEAEIRTYEGSDPLDVWYRYILWMCENFPTGGKDQTTLLERCISIFKDQERYKNDERYLKVWIRYADLCTDPFDVYNYMHSQGVCSGLANFYESWAYNLEGVSSYKKADDVYTLGINKNAQPLDRLKRQHRAFESRLAENLSSSGNEMSSNQKTEQERTTLGGLKGHGKKGTVGVKRTGNASLSSKKGAIGNSKPLVNSKSSGFAIFQEDGPGGACSLPAAAGEWQVPPVASVTTEENTQKPGKWNEAKVKQRYHSTVPFDATGTKPSFTVHVDDDVISNLPCTPKHGHVVMDNVLSSRKPDRDPTNELLRNMAKGDNTEEQKFKVMYCKEKIYTGADEFSLEELRAARLFSRLAGPKWSSLYSNEEAPPEKQFKVMYPKAEVYPFDSDEKQLEEVLARRHAGRLQAKREAARTVAMTTPQVRTVELVATSAARMTEINDDEPMELASSSKTARGGTENCQAMTTFPAQDEAVVNGIDCSARRGLTFRDASSQESSMEGLNAVPYFVPPATEPCGTPQVGAFSAFRPVQKTTTRQVLGDRPVLPTDDITPNSSNSYDTSSEQPLVGATRTQTLLTDTAANNKPLSNVQGRQQTVVPANATGMNGLNMQGLHGVGPAAVTSVVGCTTPHMKQKAFNGLLSIDVGSTFGRYRTPEGDRSDDTSHLTAPSPTVTMNTKVAMDEVMAMFNNPLMSATCDTAPWSHQNPPVKRGDDFEAAFSNENDNQVVAGAMVFGGKGSAFAIYDETKAEVPSYKQQDAENQENRPPKDYFQEPSKRPLAGVLQPSVGIPVSPVEEEEEDDQVMTDDENQPPVSLQQPDFGIDRIRDAFPTDDTNEHLTTYSSFAAAARIASTPFCGGMEPPLFSLSNIRSTNEQDSHTDNDTDFDMAHAQTGYTTDSFACTPNKILSPIFERSDEDYKSSSSSASSTGSSHHGSVSNHMSTTTTSHLSFITEERHHPATRPSAFRPVTKETSRNGSNTFQFNEDGSTDLNPFSDEVVQRLMLRLSPPVSSYEGYCDLGSDELPKIASNLAVNLGDNDVFRVENAVGTGAFAKVFRANKLTADLSADDLDEANDVILKVQKVSSDWEFYICRQLHERMNKLGCPTRLHSAFMNPCSVYSYSTGSVIVDQLHDMGTLLDVTNKYKTRSKSMVEGMVAMYTISLLRMLHTMHSCDVIHGDIKPDNILIVDSDENDGVDLKLIDFGRSVDMRLFPPGTTFNVNCYTDAFQCIEMKTHKPWTTQVDTYGMLGVLHCLLHGEYMNVYLHSGANRWKPTKGIKRHWNVKLWNKLFDTLLNVPSNTELPSLGDLLGEFEEFYRKDHVHFVRERKLHDIFMSTK